MKSAGERRDRSREPRRNAISAANRSADREYRGAVAARTTLDDSAVSAVDGSAVGVPSVGGPERCAVLDACRDFGLLEPMREVEEAFVKRSKGLL